MYLVLRLSREMTGLQFSDYICSCILNIWVHSLFMISVWFFWQIALCVYVMYKGICGEKKGNDFRFLKCEKTKTINGVCTITKYSQYSLPDYTILLKVTHLGIIFVWFLVLEPLRFTYSYFHTFHFIAMDKSLLTSFPHSHSQLFFNEVVIFCFPMTTRDGTQKKLTRTLSLVIEIMQVGNTGGMFYP